MIKETEIANGNSCLNRAKPGEMLFVLLARDPAAPVAIRAWIGERLRLGKNLPNDKQIVEAEAVVLEMNRQHQREHTATEVRAEQPATHSLEVDPKNYEWWRRDTKP